MSQQPPWPPKESPFDQHQWRQQVSTRSAYGSTSVENPSTPQQPPSWTTLQPGQLQPQPFPPGKGPQRKQGSVYKRHRRGVLLGVLCFLLVILLVLVYGVIAELGSANVSTSKVSPSPTTSGPIAVASPTAPPTLAPTPTPTHQLQPTPTPTAVPTRAPTPTPTPTPSTIRVSITNAGYTPATSTITVGSTVIWTNRGGIAHTVTGNSFDSGNMPPGSTFRFTFTKPGTYHYVCTYHPYMTGTIIVN